MSGPDPTDDILVRLAATGAGNRWSLVQRCQEAAAEILRLREMVTRAHSIVDLDHSLPRCAACDHEYQAERVGLADVAAHVAELIAGTP